VAGDGETTVVRAPTFAAELPSERDIADWTERNRARGRARTDQDNEARDEFRNTPREYHLSWSETFDDQGRFWIATERDRDEFSWLDVYAPREGTFFGSVRVRDRVLGFDVADSTLAAWWNGRRRRTTRKGFPPARLIGTTSGSGGRGFL